MKHNRQGSISHGVIIVLVGLALMVAFIVGIYNGLVTTDAAVTEAWANVQTAYQRRIDLIPNLVVTVQGSADFEKTLQTDVTELRSGLSSAQTPAQLNKISTGIDTAINLVFENYPDVKSTENFLAFQSQLEGTENRIKYERDRYNSAVKEYQVATRKLPTSLIANMFGFNADKYTLFSAEPGAANAPDVSFTFT